MHVVNTQTVEQLRTIISSAVGAKKRLNIGETTPLNEVVTSSLQFVVVIGEIERVFGIIVPDVDLTPERFRDLSTVAGLIDRVRATAV